MQTEGLKIVVGFQLDHANVLASVSDQFKQVEKAAKGASGEFVKVAGSLRELDARQKSFVQSAKAGALAYQQLGRDVAFAGEASTKLIRQQQSLQDAQLKLQRSTVNAGGAVVGFTNIIRDAPFGIIGVGNNITQLADGFAVLQHQTGSLKASLGALISGIFSPAGLFTVGLSSAISLWTVYSQNQQKAKSEAKAAADSIKSLSKIISGLSESINQNNASALAEAATLNKLFNVAKDETNSRKERISALAALKKATDGYLNSLTLETIGTDTARLALDEFNKSLFNSALLKANQSFVEDLAKSYGQFARQGEEGKKRVAELDAEIRKLNSQTPAQLGLDPDEKFEKIVALSKERNALANETNKAINEQNRLQGEILATGTKIAALTIKTQPFKVDKDSEKDIKTVSDVLADLRKELTAVDQESKKLGLSFDQLNSAVLGPLEKAFEEIAKIGGPQAEKALQSIGEEIRKVRGEFIGGETLQTKQLITFERAGKIKEIAPEFNADLIAVQQNAANFANTMGELGAKAAENFQKRFIVIGDALSGAISHVIIELEGLLENALSGIAVGIGEAIGGLITGAQGLTDVFNGLLKIIGTFIKEFGQALIVAATTRIIAEKSLVANPYLALAAGIAAVAAGAALQNIVPSFATGGTVMGPQLIMAGDNPGRKEHILSDAQLQTIAGSNVRDVRVYGVVRGRDIHLLNQEAINEGFRIN